MNLADFKTLIEMGGLAIFAYVIWKEQRGIRESIHGLRTDFQAFFLELTERRHG